MKLERALHSVPVTHVRCRYLAKIGRRTIAGQACIVKGSFTLLVILAGAET